uniref:Uncharacterized protein n=1 Tax=Cyprinus carpio TaxID=7962 RepID=A0A8C1W035_CYPCA
MFMSLSAVCAGQQDCRSGACYPAMGDLLLGREQNLHSSSTCGLMGSEVVCTPHGQWKMKCCPCDSRNPAAYNAHRIQNVISSAGPNRWWQSKKDVSPVTLQLDLDGMYHLETVSFSFKGPRPDALIVERTRDFGRSWQPVLYMATDCPSTFPQIHFYPLRQFADINLPNEHKIEVASGFTGLRVNLTRLGSVPSMPGRSLSKFYALREMRVMGSCFCHGHANRCNNLPNTQVGGVCECQHNTAGVNCEQCDALHNDLPWRPAENGNTHTCKRCECNNHADRCHFDAERYEATGRRSGGVCDNCNHHTAGPNCERCANNYYRNPLSDIRSPDTCLRCLCNAAGSVNGGQCDAQTGECVCKANVEGERCDRCKAGHYNLNANNPLGCSKCSCSPDGSVSGVCDQLTGQCKCRPHVEGLSCDRCAAGYWNPSSPNGCQPCNCDPINARSATCDQRTGQCLCRPGIGGRTCSGCPDNTYGDPLIGCRPCVCDPSGTESGGCDKRTGACLCKPGVTGARCDACSRGHCASFPECPACPSCFFSMNERLQQLTLTLERLSNQLISSGSRPTSSDASRRIQTLMDALRRLQETVSVPPQSSRALTDALQRLNQIRYSINIRPTRCSLTICQNDENYTAHSEQQLRILKYEKVGFYFTLQYCTLPSVYYECFSLFEAVQQSFTLELGVDCVSEPHSDPDEVQRVCEAVLEAQVPLSMVKLKQKLKELQNLASSLPDSSRVLENSREQLENARHLLEEANNTRYTTHANDTLTIHANNTRFTANANNTS